MAFASAILAGIRAVGMVTWPLVGGLCRGRTWERESDETGVSPEGDGHDTGWWILYVILFELFIGSRWGILRQFETHGSWSENRHGK